MSQDLSEFSCEDVKYIHLEKVTAEKHQTRACESCEQLDTCCKIKTAVPASRCRCSITEYVNYKFHFIKLITVSQI